MNRLLIIILFFSINFGQEINCQDELSKVPPPPPPPPPTTPSPPPPPPPPIGCPPNCPGYKPVCAIDCQSGCFKTYSNLCQLNGYNLCKGPYDPAHTLHAQGVCDPRLPECEYCNRNPKCIYDLGANCFKTVTDDCLIHLHNCQNPRSRWIVVFSGQCPAALCNSCLDECTQLCY